MCDVLVAFQSLNQGDGADAANGAVGNQQLGDDGVSSESLAKLGQELVGEAPIFQRRINVNEGFVFCFLFFLKRRTHSLLLRFTTVGTS